MTNFYDYKNTGFDILVKFVCDYAHKKYLLFPQQIIGLKR